MKEWSRLALLAAAAGGLALAPRPSAGQSVTRPASVPAAPPEPDPARVFASLYGAESQRAEGTPGTKDDRELGRRLYDAARQAHGTPGLQRLLYDRAAHHAGKDPVGVVTALAALSDLTATDPAAADSVDERAVAVLDKALRTAEVAVRPALSNALRLVLQRSADRRAGRGDYVAAAALAKRAADLARTAGVDPEAAAEAEDLVRAINDRKRLDARATELLTRLALPNVPKDPAAIEEAAYLLGGVLGRYQDMTAVAAASNDDGHRFVAGLAKVPAGRLSAEQAVWMGDWCRSAADRAAPAVKPALLARAAGWYACGLANPSIPEADRVRARLAAQQVGAQLAEADGAAAAKRGGSWAWGFERVTADAAAPLTFVRPARHGVAGAWTLTGQGLSAELGATAGLVALPVWPGKTYDLSVRFQAHGAAAIGVTVPVGPGAATVVREATGLSLSAVAGAAVPMSAALTDVAKDNETRTLLVRVGDGTDGTATVTVLLDGAQVGQWHGRSADLQPAAGTAPPARSAVAVYARGGTPLFVDAAVRCYAGGPPLALAVPGATDLTWDASAPRDAVADAPTATSARFAHHGATVVFDKALPGGVQVTVTDPADDVRLLRLGLPKMVAAPTALAPLGVDYVRYQRLVALSKDVPRFAADADAARLRELFAQRESGPPGSDVRVRAEWAIYATLHQVAGTYRRGAAAWGQAMQRALTPGEYELAKKMGAS